MPPRPAVLVFVANDEANAVNIKEQLENKGQKATITIQDGKIKVECIINFKDLEANKNLANDIKNDENIDCDVEYNFSDAVVNLDVNIAKLQASNIKFSYISDTFGTKVGSNEITELKNENENIEQYFEMIEQNKICPNINNTDEKQSQIIDNYNGDDEVAKWFYTQTATLKDTIERQFMGYPDDYELKAVNLLFNPKHAIKFMSYKDCTQAKLMFHGTSLKAFKSIFENGFILQKLNEKGNIGKLYGDGHYFTPQALHAIRYLTQCKDVIKYYDRKLDSFTLIAAFVNAGKVKEVRGTEYRNKPIEKGYDSHHVKVTDGIHSRYIGAPIYKGYYGDVMDEYAIKESERILPRFYITIQLVTHIFVWRDKKINNYFNGGLLKEFQEKYDGKMYGVTDTEIALKIIEIKMSQNKVFVITNGGDDGEAFVKTVREKLKLKTPILVFCSAVDWHKKWASKYDNVIVQSGKNNIVEYIKNTYKYDIKQDLSNNKRLVTVPIGSNVMLCEDMHEKNVKMQNVTI
eukprot:473546_1